VIDFAAEAQRSTVDQAVALMARILSDLGCLDTGIAAMAQSAIVVLDESRVCELFGTKLAAEAVWMPARLHRLDDPSNYNVAALVAVGREQHAKVLFAVLAAFELVKNSILEGAEALSAPKMGN
jgi:hypothetical protein